MKLTLRAARKLEGKIANRVINEGINYDVTFSAYDSTSVAEKLSRAQNTLRSDVDTALHLTQIRSGIRRQIQQLNEESGINEMVSERKKLLDALAIWKEVKAVGERTREPVSSEIIEGKIEAIRNGTVNSRSITPRESVTVRAVSDDYANEAESTIRSLETLIERLDDNILERNMGTKISLSETDVSILHSTGLL